MDGTVFWVDVSLTLMPVARKSLILATWRDITERREAKIALQKRESYLTAIMENQPGLVWLKDAECRFLMVNRAFAVSCGQREGEDVAGKTDLEVWPIEFAEKYRKDDLAVMAAGRKPSSLENTTSACWNCGSRGITRNGSNIRMAGKS
jgi:PAS domain-containing protein